MSTRQEHPIFKRYPLDGNFQIGGQQVTTPYHIYDGSILFIGGTANADAARELLRGQQLTPILNDRGQALMAVWVCDFTEANLGAHHELQFSIFAAYTPQSPVKTHPFAIYQLLTLNDSAMMVCHGLWNSTRLVVDYNREHLGLDAHLSSSILAKKGGRVQFDVKAVDSDTLLAEGDLSEPTKQDNRVMGQMAGALGLRGLWRSMRAPFVHVPVVNTISEVSRDNRIAHTYTRTDGQVIRLFDTTTDRLTIHHPSYSSLKFQPEFVQHGYGVRFVYLRPVSAAGLG